MTGFFDQPLLVAAPARTVRAARWPVLGAIACLCISAVMLVLAIMGDQTVPMILGGLGYLSGSIGVSVLVIIHRMLKQQAQQSLWYEPRRRLDRAAYVVLALGLLTGLGNAFFLATEIAKR